MSFIVCTTYIFTCNLSIFDNFGIENYVKALIECMLNKPSLIICNAQGAQAVIAWSINTHCK